MNLVFLLPLALTISLSDELVWALLCICGGITVLVFLWLMIATSRSKNALDAKVRASAEELRDVYLDANKRMTKLDNLVIDRLRALTRSSNQAFAILRQIMSKLNQRLLDVEKLLDSGSMEDLAKAQEILSSPIDNSGSQADSLVFADMILTLYPGQFALALEMIMDSIENDINSPKIDDGELPRFEQQENRKRNFTIRGFLRLLSGRRPDH